MHMICWKVNLFTMPADKPFSRSELTTAAVHLPEGFMLGVYIVYGHRVRRGSPRTFTSVSDLFLDPLIERSHHTACCSILFAPGSNMYSITYGSLKVI